MNTALQPTYPHLVAPTGANTYLPEIPYSNPLAPPWTFPQWGLPYCELEFTYTFPIVIPIATAGSSALLRLDFDVDSEFHCTDTYVLYIEQDVINDAVQLRLTDAVNKRRNSDFLTVRDYNGFIPRDWVIPPGGKQRLEIRSLTAVEPINAWIVFRGFKRFQYQRCAPMPVGFRPVEYVPLWARYSAPPPGFKDEPYAYEFDLFNTAGPIVNDIQNVTFGLDTDAPFLLRSLLIQATSIDTWVAATARMIDPWGNMNVLQANPASRNTPYAYSVNFGGVAPVSTAGRPIYPEVICPAGSVVGIQAQVSVGIGNAVGFIRMQGVKRFRIGD